MWVCDPKWFAEASDDRLFHEGYMHAQKSRMEFAIANASAIPCPDALSQAAAFVEETSCIRLTSEQLLQILSLYPMQRGKLADYGWGDTEVRELLMSVIANFLTGSRWPTEKDDVNVELFVRKLQKAASFMGYVVVNGN